MQKNRKKKKNKKIKIKILINDKTSLSYEISLLGFFFDGAGGSFMDSNRNFEAKVSCATTHEKEYSNSRGCNKKHNFSLGSKNMANCV